MTHSAGPLWEPNQLRRTASRLFRFLRSAGFDNYDEVWRWSVARSTSAEFWQQIADESEVLWFAEAEEPLTWDGSDVSTASWFPGSTLNYAERCLRVPPRAAEAVAVRAVSDTRAPVDLTWSELRDLVGKVRRGLVLAGVEKGDTVAAYLPNIPETVALVLATASLGAVWVCCSPETGVVGTLERLSQTEPVLLVSVDGYRYGERQVDRMEEVEAIRAGLPSLRATVWLSYLHSERVPPIGWTNWDEFASGKGDLEFEPVAFDHPLYILFSSGTTGPPKAIIHGHGGILLEHTKALGMHFDLGIGDVFFWFTTTGWMMWNFCVSGLAVDSTIVLFDGDPSGDTGERLWEIMATTETTVGGVGAGYLVANMKQGKHPRFDFDLSRMKTLGSTGSPLPAAAAGWVYEAVSPDILLASFSGGTDVCTGFVGASPLHAVWPGEISCRCLGAKVEVFDEHGVSIIGSEGELVMTAPLPSMPVGILGDVDGTKYRSTYFGLYPGVWAHGDRATLTERGTVVISGRSDGTLNRGGVRMGTAEFYSVVEALPSVKDSLIVHVEDPVGGPGRLMLFVVPVGDEPSEKLKEEIRGSVRRQLSPRHVPDVIQMIQAIPRTLSGKKMEVPMKRLLSGANITEVLAAGSVADPAALLPFLELAQCPQDLG